MTAYSPIGTVVRDQPTEAVWRRYAILNDRVHAIHNEAMACRVDLCAIGPLFPHVTFPETSLLETAAEMEKVAALIRDMVERRGA